MWKLISIIVTGIITSFYFFPFEFTFLPGVNVKMMLAALGLGILGIQMARGKNGDMNNDFFVLSILAIIVSLIGFFSITLNNTQDYAYATYIVSMWVWLSAAYVLCNIIKFVHGELSIVLLTKYLVCVCAIQCIFALLIDNYPNIKHLVDTYVAQGQTYLTEVKRLYGIGASLDVAGSRFSVVLVLIVYLLIQKTQELHKFEIILGITSFFIIATVGNMIARTTTVGVVLAVLYLAYALFFNSNLSSKSRHFMILSISVALLIFIPLSVYLYNESPFFYKQFRFAFEGFFSLAEEGEWSVDSNETLKTMVVFPETIKTWFVGDGYFSNPINVDPYFIGKVTAGFYMGTDVGYLRFIFYFGLIGLIAISSFIIKSGLICIRKFQGYKLLFVMLLMINFIVWFKVSTDIFLVFALFLMISKEENEAYDNRLKLAS